MLHEELTKANMLLEEGNYNKALYLLENFEENENLTIHDLISYNLLRSSLLNKVGSYNDAFKYAEQAYQKSQEASKNLQSIDALLSMAYALVWELSLDKAFELIEQSENLLKTCIDESPKEISYRKASIAYIKSLYHFFKSDLNQSLHHAELSIKLREELGAKNEIAEPLNVLGIIYTYLKYDWDRAIAYLERSQKLAEESNQKHIVAHNLMIFGALYALKGELEQSILVLNQCQIILEELNNKRHLSQFFNIIANTYKLKGELEQSLIYLEEGLAISEEIGNQWVLGYILSTMIEIYVDKKDNKNAQKYLEMFKLINDEIGNKMMDKIYSLSKALVLKMSSRTRNRAKAEKLFKQIIEEENITGDLSISALVNLCDLLLGELRITNDIEVIDELKPHINQLINIAEKTKSSWILTETYLLQAKLSLITFKIKKAQRFLIQAQQIANRFNLNQLTKKIAKENDDLLKKLDLWEKLKEAGAPIAKRFDLARLDDQIVGMVQNLTMLTPQVTEEKIAIHKEKKICLVCRGEVLRYTYICECGAIYCENCARAVSNLENICWACDEPIDYLKSVKPYKEEEKVEVEKRGKKK